MIGSQNKKSCTSYSETPHRALGAAFHKITLLTKAHPAISCLFTAEIKMYRCSLCSYTTRFPSYLKRHSFVHNPTKFITCSLCSSKFKENCAYRLHMKEKHGPRAHVCHICGLEFTYQRVLEIHLLCHEDCKPISCSFCGYKCKRKQDLRRHTHERCTQQRGED